MNYIDRGIIKWQPFKSLDKFFKQVEQLKDEQILSCEDSQLFSSLLLKHKNVPFMKNDNVFMCIDVKSFYASCEIVSRNLDVYKTKLCVVGDINNEGSIIMANSHALKKEYNIGNIMRYYELKKILNKHNDSDTIIADTHMQKFIDYSTNLTKLLMQLISKEDIYHYSIDELFLDYKPYKNMYGENHVAFALALKEYVFIKTGLPLVIGIGKNMVTSKYVLDIFAKKNELNVCEMTNENYVKFLKITNLQKLWGIGFKIAQRLEKLRIFSVKHLHDASDDMLHKEFGVIGIELKKHVQLIDNSTWKQSEKKLNFHQDLLNQLVPKEKTIGEGQTLFRDYYDDEILVILHDMTLKTLLKLTNKKLITKKISLSIRYSSKIKIDTSGFSRQKTLDDYTCNFKELYAEILSLFKKHYIKNTPIRMISIGFGKLAKNTVIKNEVFEVINQYQSESKPKIFYGTQLLKESNYVKRHTKIGGHKG